jgi:hypothetical protein
VTAQSTVLSLVALGSYFKDRVPAKRKKELVVFSQLTSQLFYSAVALSLGASRSDLRAFPYLVVGGLQLLHVLVMFFAVLAKRSWATQLLLASNAAIGGAGTVRTRPEPRQPRALTPRHTGGAFRGERAEARARGGWRKIGGFRACPHQ